MTGAASSADINFFIDEARRIADNVKDRFSELTVEQLNWKPAADQWSIAQCLDHLITANRQFFPDLERIIAGQPRRHFSQLVPFLPSLIGRLVVSAVNPESDRKVNAPQIFLPASSDIDDDIVERFLEHQTELIKLFQAAKGLNLNREKIASPVSDLLSYSLKDCFTIIVYHEERHFQQAERLLMLNQFPLKQVNIITL